MEIVILIFKILFLFLASVISIVYILFQLYKKFPSNGVDIKTADYIVYFIVSLLFGFAANSYFGLAAFVPLILVKIITSKVIIPEKIKGQGHWMEIDWKKLKPRGFERNVPKHILEEMNKMINSMPNDTHIIVPRIYARIAIYFIMKKIKKDSQKMSKGFSVEQQNLGLAQFNQLAQNILKLEPGMTEKKDLNVGILKVTRL